jgi:hypothetical protein
MSEYVLNYYFRNYRRIPTIDNTKLKQLIQNYIDNPYLVLEYIKNNKIYYLNLSCNNHIESILYYVLNANIQMLDLSSNIISVRNLRNIFENNIIRELCISYCYISNLDFLRYATSITKLIADHNFISDLGCYYIAENKTLSYVNLENNKINDLGYEFLKQNKNLTTVLLKYNDITINEINEQITRFSIDNLKIIPKNLFLLSTTLISSSSDKLILTNLIKLDIDFITSDYMHSSIRPNKSDFELINKSNIIELTINCDYIQPNVLKPLRKNKKLIKFHLNVRNGKIGNIKYVTENKYIQLLDIKCKEIQLNQSLIFWDFARDPMVVCKVINNNIHQDIIKYCINKYL